MELACLIFAIVTGGGIALAALVNMFMPFVGQDMLGSGLVAVTGAAIAAGAAMVMKGKL